MKSYGKGELAALYMPHSTPGAARKQLSLWIKYNKELLRELRQTGYTPQTRLLTPLQVELIFRYLGEPLDDTD